MCDTTRSGEFSGFGNIFHSVKPFHLILAKHQVTMVLMLSVITSKLIRRDLFGGSGIFKPADSDNFSGGHTDLGSFPAALHLKVRCKGNKSRPTEAKFGNTSSLLYWQRVDAFVNLLLMGSDHQTSSQSQMYCT